MNENWSPELIPANLRAIAMAGQERIWAEQAEAERKENEWQEQRQAQVKAAWTARMDEAINIIPAELVPYLNYDQMGEAIKENRMPPDQKWHTLKINVPGLVPFLIYPWRINGRIGELRCKLPNGELRDRSDRYQEWDWAEFGTPDPDEAVTMRYDWPNGDPDTYRLDDLLYNAAVQAKKFADMEAQATDSRKALADRIEAWKQDQERTKEEGVASQFVAELDEPQEPSPAPETPESRLLAALCAYIDAAIESRL